MIDESDAIRSRKIVKRFLAKLTQKEPQMYYATTSEVARAIQTMIKEHLNRLDIEEQHLVRRLTIKDIEVMLGFSYK